jgi:hypothetical protein
LLCVGLVAAHRLPSDMVVHEWGTFLAMNGSDGVSLDGMYHEEHALPSFVHARSRDQLRLRSVIVKGETPVIYFYAKRPEQVRVQVGFPTGLWTQWYPQADLVGPALAQVGSPPRLRNGHISWNVTVVPPESGRAGLPPADEDALWNYARDVDASYVSAVDSTRGDKPKEWERFIFYRGLGDAPLPVEVGVDGDAIGITSSIDLRHLYVLRVEGGRAAYSYVPALASGGGGARIALSMNASRPLGQFVDEIAADLAGRLVESGLYAKEARAMVNTWRTSYFKTDGVRVLFVLPGSWTNTYIPLEMTPAPAELVRVMVGRVEVLTKDRERRAEAAVRDLASPDAATRERAFATLRDEGRYVEPIVRRTLRTTSDERVRELSRRLLLTDFVTELRTSLRNAADGEALPQNPIYARAQLASLLREVGLTSEAREEGKATLAALETMPQPDMSRHDSRHMFRALARANEGAGRDREALRWYGDFVRFGTQSCSGCHEVEGPRTRSFFRDWWAGRKFGEYAEKTGETARLIEHYEAELSRNGWSIQARIALAYLYEARGDLQRSAALWSEIDPSGRHAFR